MIGLAYNGILSTVNEEDMSDCLKDFLRIACTEQDKERPSAKKLLRHPFITEPIPSLRTVTLDSDIRRIRCTTRHVIALCKDGAARVIDSEALMESKDLSKAIKDHQLQKKASPQGHGGRKTDLGR